MEETALLMFLIALGVIQLLTWGNDFVRYLRRRMVSARASALPPATTTDEPSCFIGATGSAPSGSISATGSAPSCSIGATGSAPSGSSCNVAGAKGEPVVRLRGGEHRTKKFVGVTEVNTIRGAGNRVRHFEKKLHANSQCRGLTQPESPLIAVLEVYACADGNCLLCH